MFDGGEIGRGVFSSVTGKVAGGAHMVLFTTGKGTPTGSPVAPVIKISSNNKTFLHLKEDIDMSAGDVLEGTKTLKEIGREIVERVIETANGLPAKSEYFNMQEFAIPNVSVIRPSLPNRTTSGSCVDEARLHVRHVGRYPLEGYGYPG